MRQREAVRSGAEEGGKQSRQGYSSAAPSLLPSRMQLLTEANRSCRNLNRQIQELETALSLRKQRTADCLNRPKSSFLSTRHSPLITRISNRELWGLEILQLAENKHPRIALIANFEPNRFFNFRSDVSK
jgi:hypothetical protein